MKRMFLRRGMLIAVIAGSIFLSRCGSGVQGTYSDPAGAFVLDLKSGGKSTLTFMGESAACTYNVNGKSLTLECQGQAGKIILTIHDDGSLTGSPGTFMPALRKTKS